MAGLSRKRVITIVAIVVAIPVLAIVWWLGSPLFLSKTVEEEFPLSQGAVVPTNMTPKEVEDIMAGMAKVDSPMEEPMPTAMPESTLLKSGQFKGADSFHNGEGKATIYRLPDGTNVLRLESFKVTNGPDLHVILTPLRDPGKGDDIHQEGYSDLGKLKGNMGNQNYPLPADADPESLNSAVIYCVPFGVIFAVAPLQ